MTKYKELQEEYALQIKENSQLKVELDILKARLGTCTCYHCGFILYKNDDTETEFRARIKEHVTRCSENEKSKLKTTIIELAKIIGEVVGNE